MPPVAALMESDEPAVIVVLRLVHRDMGLRAVHALRLGFDPDAIFFGTDTYSMEFPAKDLKDVKIEPSELQRRAEAGDPSIGQNIVGYKVQRDGTLEGWFLPFTGSGPDTFHWTEKAWKDERPSDDGFVPRELRLIMTENLSEHPFLVETTRAAREMFGSGYDRRRELYHRGSGVLKALERMNFVCFDICKEPA
jgi:hypothetical protein